MRTIVRALALCVFFGAVAAPQHKAKQPAAEIVDMKARRNDDIIELTAEVKNSGEKPLKDLEVIFNFEDSDGAPVSTEEMKIDEKSLPPGGSSSLNVQLRDAPRATQILIGVKVGGGVELSIGGAGPYTIE